MAGADHVAGADHWFEELADYMGETYLRYSFTKGTANEVAFLIDELGLEPGMRLLDVGCGPGRHALAFAEAGIHVTGIDISQRFVDLANAAAQDGTLNARFLRADARQLEYSSEFDVSTGVHHETTIIHNEGGVARDAELWTTCFTPRELRLLFDKAGLDVTHLWSVDPGSYARRPPDLEHAEFLVVAETLSAGMHLGS